MKPRYPLWMIAAFLGEILAMAVFAFFFFLMSTMFRGEIPPSTWLGIASLILAVIGFGLSVWQWRKGNTKRAKQMLLLAPAFLAVGSMLATAWISIFPPAPPQ